MYGSIDLNKTFNVNDESQVAEHLRPYLYRDKNGILRLNISIKNKKEAHGRYTHELISSTKGVMGNFLICDLAEYERRDSSPGTVQKTAPKNNGDTDKGSGASHGFGDLPF